MGSGFQELNWVKLFRERQTVYIGTSPASCLHGQLICKALSNSQAYDNDIGACIQAIVK